MSERRRIELREDRIPLEGIAESVSEVVELFGGRIRAHSDGEILFTLPSRRGVAAAGGVDCRMTWAPQGGGEGEGTVVLTTGAEVGAARVQQILLLAVGAAGALVWILWPFFPTLGALSWIGGAVAVAAWCLTLRR
ncbi:MAG TPA: hypothetical protein VM534_03025, partial [Thermoanaerobaculia bacterium]|nr:hypothetical protein [Thermoanaerobaculia bacterium]